MPRISPEGKRDEAKARRIREEGGGAKGGFYRMLPARVRGAGARDGRDLVSLAWLRASPACG